MEKLSAHRDSMTPPSDTAATDAAVPRQSAPECTDPAVLGALFRLLTSATATAFKCRSLAAAGSRITWPIPWAWATFCGVSAREAAAAPGPSGHAHVADCGKGQVCAAALAPLIVACLLPRLACSAAGSDSLVRPAWSALLTMAVDACSSLLSRAYPQLALRVLTSSLVTTWIRSRSNSAYCELAAVRAVDVSLGSLPATAGPSVEGPIDEVLGRYADCIANCTYVMARSTQAEISAAEGMEGLECKEGAALLEALRGQLRGPLLSLLDGDVLDGLSMREGLLNRSLLAATLGLLYSSLLTLAGLCPEGFLGYQQQRPNACETRSDDNSGDDGSCRWDTAAASRQLRAAELYKQHVMHIVPFQCLRELMSDANVALSLHRCSLSPEAQAAMLPPGAKTATLSPEAEAAMLEQGSAAARECLRLIRQLADRVWPRAQVGEGQLTEGAVQQEIAADGPEQGTAAVQQGPVDGQAAGSGRCTFAAANDDGLDWESVQSELLLAGLQGGSDWGEALWCFNPACANLEGPSELALKTYACGGGCGVRYCSRGCQEEDWRRSHCKSCVLLGKREAEEG